jgi:lysophospholipase L1-like esterase
MSLPRRAAFALVVASALLLAFATGAAAATSSPPKHRSPKVIHPPARVKVGRVEAVRTASGKPAILVAVRYPIQAAGRKLRLGARIQLKPGTVPLAATGAARVSAGPLSRPERRRTFTFVHEIDLQPRLARLLSHAWAEGRSPLATVEAQGGIDIDGDGKYDFGRKGIPRRVVHLAAPGRRGPRAARAAKSAPALCADFAVREVKPGATVKVPLPTCDRAVGWKVRKHSAGVRARVRRGSLVVKASTDQGTESVALSHGTAVLKVTRPWSGGPLGADQAAAAGPVVRAMGDSVTAGYGYYSDGSQMSIFELPECKPFGQVLDDACSSNSTATKSGLHEVPYAPDYGLSNDVSWAAQWANEYGVTNYKNFAISGSEPTNWAPGGDDYATTKQIESEDPDYILMTIGANPILAETLFGLEPMACAIEADILGDYRLCVEEAFEAVHLSAELKRLYTDLVENSSATIYLMQYHLAVPSSAIAYTSTQIAEMAKLMNQTIADVAGEVNAATGTRRLQVVTPPHFDVGVNLEPVYPATYSCSSFGFTVDGPSVQSTPTQDELEALHYASFCRGPASGGPPWIISGDTGIHPTATGYAQMASQVPPPAAP